MTQIERRGLKSCLELIARATMLNIILTTSVTQSQFVSHFNSRGLIGNITFDLDDSSAVRMLVIQSFLEAAYSVWPPPDVDPGVREIQFEWSLHTNTLEFNMISSCSDDDLGQPVHEDWMQDILAARHITLGVPKKTTVSFDDLLVKSANKSLSALLWGKSIKLKLSGINEQSQQSSDQQASGTLSRPAKPVNITPRLSSATRPTFAPRAKPNLPKLALPSLPKPEALIAEEVPVSNISTTAGAPPSSIEPAKHLELDRGVVRAFGRVAVCGNIVDRRKVKSVEAVFESQIAGKVTLRGNEDDVTLLMPALYHVRSKVTTRHDWKIMASDILDERTNEEKCKYLSLLFDPYNTDDTNCKRNDTTKCRMGDLTKKHGQVLVAGQGRNARSTLIDLNLPLSALEGTRSVFLVIYEVAARTSNNGLPTRQNAVSCAQLHSVAGRTLEAVFNMDGVRGTLKVSQRHQSEPASLTYDLFGLEGNVRHLSIREIPTEPRSSSDNSKICSNLGNIFNPTRVDVSQPKSIKTIDAFAVGNITAKHGQLFAIDSDYEDHYVGEYLDLGLQTFGLHTIAGRSVLIHKNNGDPWVCATLNHVEEPVLLAVARFHYPVVGQISFRQLANEPHSETSVLVDVYQPNGDKLSENHNWLVHAKPAMADFYNWSRRCDSAGDVFDPILSSIGLNNEVYNRQCLASFTNEPLRCRAGDTSAKAGFRLSLPLTHTETVGHYYTDLFLPLSGLHSILGRSVVIYDDSAPTQRGNRLACSTVKRVHPLKASVKTWSFGQSIPSQVRGSISFDQDTAARSTQIKMNLAGLNGSVENYAVHQVWTMEDREFPCSNDSLYDIYDPFNRETSQPLPPSAHYGALATVDRVKVGDLSRKHGTLETLQSAQKTYRDPSAALFAPNSIVGRSVVLRASGTDFRWVCGNIELDYDRGVSREIIAIASFDDVRSRVAGFVRFVQLEHKDGSLSDTFVQVDLRKQHDLSSSADLQHATSNDFDWSVFVNQVGEDAFIVADDVRCISAGFKWNPYLARDTHEAYESVCTPTSQLGCAMGDLGLRHGKLNLGANNRRVLSDTNLPLAGNYSIMGRSLVIFDNKRPSVKLACANIMPDMHLKSNVVIKITPSFTVARFVEQMRSLLGAADWLMVPELKAAKVVANGECMQLTIHFYGQRAHQMQVELNNLITLGTVRKSTRSGVERISTHYRLCRAGQQQLNSFSNQRFVIMPFATILTCLVAISTIIYMTSWRKHTFEPL